MTRTILMIDDELTVRNPVVEELQLSGYDVVLHHDTDSALDQLQRHSGGIDLVVLDIMMPSGEALRNFPTNSGLRTGVYLYEIVRARAPDVPIVILTNVSDPSVAEFFWQRDKTWFLRKEDYFPFELVEQIDKILDN